jgi:hypothetical protein
MRKVGFGNYKKISQIVIKDICLLLFHCWYLFYGSYGRKLLQEHKNFVLKHFALKFFVWAVHCTEHVAGHWGHCEKAPRQASLRELNSFAQKYPVNVIVWRVALLLYVYTCRSLNSNPRCNMLINPPIG